MEPGFQTRDVWTARLSLTAALYTREDATQLYHDVVERLAATPGVEAVTLVSAMPFSGAGGSSSFQIVGREVPDAEKQPEALRRTVLPGYHQALGIPLREGRHLDPSDRILEAPVVVISESLADRYWPDGDAVGNRLSRDRREWDIVGVVADVLHSDLGIAAQPTFYVPFDVAESRHRMTVVIRSTLDEGIGDLVRQTVWAVDRDVPVEDVTAASTLVARSTQDERFRSLLLTLFAVAATLLCAMGLFAVTTRIVTARRRELGIRLALGAQRGQLVRRVALEESGALGIGLLLGTLGAFAAGASLEGFLFGVTAQDPVSFVGAALVLTLTGAAATLLAARRGARLDPTEAIRME